MTREELETLLKGRRSARLVYRKSTKEVLGLFYEWRKENPNESIMSSSDFGTFELGVLFTDYPHYKEARALLGLEDLHKQMIKEHWLVEGAKRREAEKAANLLLDEAEAELESLASRLGATVTTQLDGDTYGAECRTCLTVTVNGFDFYREIE